MSNREATTWYSPAYLDREGNPVQFGHETVLREFAQAEVDARSTSDPENTYVLVTREVNPWTTSPPVESVVYASGRRMDPRMSVNIGDEPRPNTPHLPDALREKMGRNILRGSAKFCATISPTPTPPDADQGLLAAWRGAGLSSPRDGHGDTEDWTEQACRLRIAVRAGMDINTGSGAVPEGTPVWGPLHRFASHTTDQERRAQRYSLTATFADPRVSGRETYLSDPARFPSLVAAIGAGQRIWFKALASKTYMGVLDFTGQDSITATDVTDALHGTDAEWMLVHLPQDPSVLMVYREIPMEHEYRLFVVNSTPVTGAGCIETDTPLDNTDPFNTAMRRIRSDLTGQVESRPDLVETYVGAARDHLLERFAEEGLTTFVMDMAMSNGKPVVIELNGMLNAGLYAIDIDCLSDAISSHPSQFAARRTLSV